MKAMRIMPFCLLALLGACEQPPASLPEADTSVQADQPSAAELAVTELLREEQTARLRRLGASSQVFADAIDGLLGDPTEERLATAREGWSQLYRSFNETVVVLACRASGSAPLAAALQRVDPFPILPGYIDGLAEWPDSGIVNDVSLPLTRDALLGQQGVTAQEEISLGFQVIAFLLYGEPAQPRNAAALTRVTEISADNPLALDEQPENRRRSYLALATALLVEDLLLLSADTEALSPVGSQCPVDALRRTTERMIRVAGLHDRESVAGEYFAGHSRTIALSGLQQAMTPWLAEQSAFRVWLAEAGIQSELPAAQFSGEPDILILQQLHAGLSAGRSLLN